jgi:hypothetical protein
MTRGRLRRRPRGVFPACRLDADLALDVVGDEADRLRDCGSTATS